MSAVPRKIVSASCAAIVNHPAILKILHVVNLLRVVFLVRRGPLGLCPFPLSVQLAYAAHRWTRSMEALLGTPEGNGRETAMLLILE